MGGGGGRKEIGDRERREMKAGGKEGRVKREMVREGGRKEETERGRNK